MEKSRVANDGYKGIGNAGHIKAVRYAHARAHRAHRVRSVERRQCSQIVAANVARDDDFFRLAEEIEGAAMRTPRAQDGGTTGYIRRRYLPRALERFFEQDARFSSRPLNDRCGQFATRRKDVLATTLDTHNLDLIFDERV